MIVRPELRKPADLRGKTIAAPAGSTSHWQLMYFLQIAGLTDLVTVRHVQPSEVAVLWQAGQIDGTFLWAPYLHDLRAAFDTHTLTTGSALANLGGPTAMMYVAHTNYHAPKLSGIASKLHCLPKVYSPAK